MFLLNWGSNFEVKPADGGDLQRIQEDFIFQRREP